MGWGSMIGMGLGGAAGFALGGPAGAMAGAALGGGLGGGAESLFGSGDENSSTRLNVAAASPEEQELLKKLLAGYDTSNSPMAGSEADLAAAFKDHLAKYLASSNGQVSPEVLKQATDYVDQTFTNPAQASFDQFQRQYMANANEQAAALGRQPMDSSIQQQNFRTLGDISAQLGAQRGSQIAQRVDQKPMEQLNFINGLNQQAFTNRIGLMNLQSGLYNNMQDYRVRTAGGSSSKYAPDLGFLGNASAIAQGLNSAKTTFGGLFGGMGGSGGGSSDTYGTRVFGSSGTNVM